MPPTSAALSAKLIFPTKEIVEEYYLPIIYTACRTCYSEQVPDQIWDKAVSRQVADEKQQNLVRKVMESGHGSTIEHVNFTFAISGVTRTLSHQLVRHRAGTAFDQQSQRYVSFKKRDNFTIPDSITKGDLPDDLAGRFQRADRREPRPVRPAAPGRGAGRGRPLHLPERDADEPDHDGEPAPAHPHERPAAVHDGAVGDPPAVQADPPRDLPRHRRSSAASWRRSACRSATATRWATATSTAASGPTGTPSWPCGRRTAAARWRRPTGRSSLRPSPFRPKPRRVPLPVADGDGPPSHGEPVGAQLGQAGDSDRV